MNRVELDFLGDLLTDTHGVWEIFEFIRSKEPLHSDEEIYFRGEDMVSRWVEKGWIEIAKNPLYPSTISSLEEMLSQLRMLMLKSKATQYFENAPSIDLTKIGESYLKGVI